LKGAETFRGNNRGPFLENQDLIAQGETKGNPSTWESVVNSSMPATGLPGTAAGETVLEYAEQNVALFRLLSDRMT
jgi:hypothetical protein